MAAGDLVVAPYQFELRTTLMGDGTIYGLDRSGGGVSGLFDDPAKFAETEYLHADGSFIGEQHNGARTASLALKIQGDTETATWAGLSAMRTIWAPDATAAVPLYFQFPSIGKKYVNGWPLGLVGVDISMAVFKQIRVLASFRITDPTIYT